MYLLLRLQYCFLPRSTTGRLDQKMEGKCEHFQTPSVLELWYLFDYTSNAQHLQLRDVRPKKGIFLEASDICWKYYVI